MAVALPEPGAAPRPTVGVLWERTALDELPRLAVSYQNAQFHHLERYADVVSWERDAAAHAAALAAAGGPSAVIAFDERATLTNPTLPHVTWPDGTSFVWVGHDYWLRPLSLAAFVSRQPNPLLVLRHESGRRLFERLLPGVPKVVQRPGVETSIFHPRGPKRWDVLLSGSETPDYPVRQRLNRVVREHAPRRGWKLLDLTSVGLCSNPLSDQLAYAPALAAAKVSPTGTSHGGRAGATLVVQYLDHSEARAARSGDPYDTLELPELATEHVDTSAVTPRYLESLASGTLLVGDLPAGDPQEWYRDKMAVVDESMSDEEIVELIDRYVRADDEREELCDRALRAVLETETSQLRARELAGIVADHLAATA